MQPMQPKILPLAPVENPLALYSQSMHQCFTSMLAEPDMAAEPDVSTTEQANLLRYLDSPARGPELPLREKIQALLLQLKPVAHCLIDVDETTEQALAPLSVLVKTLHESLPWASLEPRVLHPLERLRDYYETAYRELISGTPEARVSWLTWKAQLSIPSVGHYLISVNAARQLLCRDELGQTVKRNNEGNHAVVFRDGLVFKPNPQVEDKADPIEPGMEHAVVAWHQLLANSPNSAASTDIVKLRQVPFKLETGATVLEGGVVQCGLMIRGILLLDMLYLQETMQHWVNCLGQAGVEAVLPMVLFDITLIASQDKSKTQSQTIEQGLKDFCAYSKSLPPEQGLNDIDKLLNSPQLFSDAVEYIKSKGGLPALHFAFTWSQRHPKLMQDQSMADVLSWAEGFKVLFKLSPDDFPLSAKDQIEISLHWAKRLNQDNITSMALTSLLTYPTDGKGDNYMVTFRVDEVTHQPNNFHIIGIDSDRALLTGDVPLEGITCRPGIGKNAPPVYWPDLNCLFLVLQDVLSLPISQPIVNHLLSKTPLQWVEAWLASVLYKTQQWQEWEALKILLPEDIAIIKDDMKTKRLDIPVQLPTKLMDGLLSRLEKMQQLFQGLAVLPELTVKDIFFAFEPILAAYYETLMERFPHQPLKAHERIHKPFDRKYGGQLEIKTLLGSRLQTPISQLAILAAPPASPNALSLQPNTTLEVLLTNYQIQANNAEHNLGPIEQLADHLAESPQGVFTGNDFTNENQIHITLQRLEALGRLGAKQFRLSLGTINGALLAKTIHHAIHFANPGALRLLLLERERRLIENAESLRLREPDGLLQHLNDTEGRNLWHVLFSKLNAANYVKNRGAAEHITSLLAQVIPHQINNRDNEGQLAIFTLVRRIVMVPEQVELVLSRLVTLGLDFTLTEKSDKTDMPDETPLGHAMQMCLDRPEKPPLNAATLLLRYGAGRAVSLSLAQAFFQQFRQSLGIEEALNQLRQQNRVFAWQLALNTLTDPLNIGNVPKNAWLIEGTKSGKRYLAPEIVVRVKQTQVEIPANQANQISQTKQNSSTADEQYGRHEVLPVKYRDEQMHLKILPELPGLEYAVGSLYRHFFNYGLPETELFRFPSINKGQPLAVLFSQTIVGENLHDVLKSGNDNAAAKLSQLDIGRFTELFIMHLLTNPEDGKDDNYQLVSFINTQGQERYAIVPIDNDHAFVDAFRIETDKDTGDPVRLLQIKTIIYCLDAMHWPLDKSVIQKFVSLSIAQKLTGWLTELTETEQSFNQLFNNKKERQQLLKHTTHPVIIGVPFAPKKIAMLYDKARKLQKLFQKHVQAQINQPDKPMLSGLEILKKLEPTLGHYYEEAFHAADTPQARFFYLAKDLYAVDVRGQQQTMLSGIVLLSTQNITEKDLLNQDERYSPKQALREIEQVRKEYTQLETVRGAVQGGNINALNALLLDKHKQQVILGLDLLKLNSQEALWQYLSNKKTAVAFEKLKIQGANDKPITTLTDDILKKLLSQSPHLRELHLAHSPHITESSLGKLDVLCPSLMTLRLFRLLMPRLNRLLSLKDHLFRLGATMSLDALRVLEIIDCPELNTIDIRAKLLSELFVSNTPKLSDCKTHSEKLKFLTLQHSNLSAIQQWRELVAEQSYLTFNKINIDGDVKELQFYVDLITAYPILLSIDWDPYKNSVLSDEIKKLLTLFIDLKSIYPALKTEHKKVFLNLIITILKQERVPSNINLILKLFDQFKVRISTLNAEDQKTLFVSLITTLEKVWRFKKQTEIVIPALLTALRNSDNDVRVAAAGALGGLKQANPDVIPALLTTLRDSDNDVRVAAAGALGGLKQANPDVIPALLTALRDEKSDVRAAAAGALVKLAHENPDVIEGLLTALRDRGRNSGIRVAAAGALVKLGHENPDVIQALLTAALWGRDSGICVAAAGALVKLGHENPDVIQALLTALGNRNSGVRAAAAGALGGLKQADPDVIPALLTALGDFDNDVRAAAAGALGELKLKQAGPDVIPALLTALMDSDNDVRAAAAGALVKLGHENPDVIEGLLTALRDRDSGIRAAAAGALVKLGHENPDAILALLTALGDKAWYVRTAAAGALGGLKQANPDVIPALLTALRDSVSNVRVAAAGALVKLGHENPDVIEGLLTALRDGVSTVRVAAAGALVKLGHENPDAILALLTALGDKAWYVRVAAAGALGGLKQANPDVIQALLTALRDEKNDVRAAAADALGELAKSLQEQISKNHDELEALLAKFEQIYLPAAAKAIEVEDGDHVPFGKIRNEDAVPSMTRPVLSLSAVLAQPNGPAFFAPDVVSTQQQDAMIVKTEEEKDSFMLNQSH